MRSSHVVILAPAPGDLVRGAPGDGDAPPRECLEDGVVGEPGPETGGEGVGCEVEISAREIKSMKSEFDLVAPISFPSTPVEMGNPPSNWLSR
jgi:hypothetical protein